MIKSKAFLSREKKFKKFKKIINENFIAIVFIIIIITLCTNIFLRFLYKKYHINSKVEIYKNSRNNINSYFQKYI